MLVATALHVYRQRIRECHSLRDDKDYNIMDIVYWRFSLVSKFLSSEAEEEKYVIFAARLLESVSSILPSPVSPGYQVVYFSC